MSAWLEPEKVSVPPDLLAEIGGYSLLAEALLRRGITSANQARAFLDPRYYRPQAPQALPGMSEALVLLAEAIRRQTRICVWGDFDVDGQTSTAILLTALQALGADVCYHIPLRETESHGISLPALRRVFDETGAQLLLSCDTGISAAEAVAYAQERGLAVIITDHHALPPELPPAEAIINPRLLPDEHPLAGLPGSGVAYKLAEGLCAQAGRAELLPSLLELAALGIVADVAPLTGDTRYLLQLGLEQLRTTERPGLLALFKMAKINRERLSEEHIGYLLAPRMNAVGRLADADLALELLITHDPARAEEISLRMEELNEQRKREMGLIYDSARAQLEREPELLQSAVLVLSHPQWHPGVIGIVAGRLAERYQRPVVLISAPPDGPARGSARSIPGFDITAALAAHPELLLSFGGHPAAAGLSMRPEDIAALRQSLSSEAEAARAEKPLGSPLAIDGYLSFSALTLPFAEALERCAPFGHANPNLVLVSRSLAISNHSPLGRNGDHRQLTVEEPSGHLQRVIWWQGAEEDLPPGRFDLAYSLRANDERGQRQVLVEWLEAHPLAEEEVSLAAPSALWEVIDCRHEADPQALLAALREKEDLQIWREGESAIAGRNRYELQRGPSLAVWSIPPGPAEFTAALERVQPQRLYIFSGEGPADDMASFMRRLTGLVKYALQRNEGRGRLRSLAAATAQRETTVRLGLAWLAARGFITPLDSEAEEWTLRPGSRLETEELPEISRRLKAVLAETAAYRAYFRQRWG